MSADQNNDTWYIRRGSTIQGPYDVETLHRYLLLGRVRLTDRASPDGHTWQPLTQRVELIPEEMRDLESEEGRARFEAARRAADERGSDGSGGQRIVHRRRREEDPASAFPASRALLGLLVVAAAAVLAAIGYHDTWLHGPAGPPACDAAPGPGINWSYCTKDGLELAAGTDLSELRAVNASLRNARLDDVDLHGATLAYADLTGVSLAGADLRGADLEGAVLRGADLRGASLVDARLNHADLREARIDGVDLAGADVARVVWPDGAPCGDRPPESCLLP